MTQEEKAKAYDIALDKIRRLLGTGSNCSREDLEHVFPELMESEDERIRKEIIAHIKWCEDSGYCAKEEMTRWITWLEKQGEQESRRITSAETKEALYDKPDNHTYSFEDMYEASKQCYDSKYNKDEYCHEQSFKWGFQEGAEWREEKAKQEWSEEDNEHLERILKELGNQRQRPLNSPYLDKIESDYNWLKSLRPQSQWKPSEEQMAALEDAIYHVDDAVATQIAKLIGDLKNI